MLGQVTNIYSCMGWLGFYDIKGHIIAVMPVFDTFPLQILSNQATVLLQKEDIQYRVEKKNKGSMFNCLLL